MNDDLGSEQIKATTHPTQRTGTSIVSLHDRMNSAAGDFSYRELGRLTDTHPETVRRYMQGQAPSVTFLTNLCEALEVSVEWLLTGRGQMQRSEDRPLTQSQDDQSSLLTMLINSLTDLCDRVDQLEQFAESFDTRLSSLIASQSEHHKAQNRRQIDQLHASDAIESRTSGAPNAEKTDGNNQTQKDHGNTRTNAQRIRDAIAKRPS